MKRLRALLLAMLMVLSLLPTAWAAEEPDAPVTPTEFYVKYKAYDIRQVWLEMVQEINPATTSYNPAPKTFTEDMTLTVDGVDYPVHCVRPVFNAADLPTIRADSEHNMSYSNLNKYVEANFTYTQTNAAYETARGNVYRDVYPPTIDRNTYVSTGTTYTLTFQVWGAEVPVKLNVTPVDSSTPDVYIGTNRIVECTPTTVEYSTDGRNWATITSGRALPYSCKGMDILFRSPATAQVGASDSIWVYCKDDQQPPSVKLTLDANSYSVWITNPGDFKGCEFSIDDKYYSDKTLWEGLSANTRYTVYVRYPSNRLEFASPPLTGNISTTAGPQTTLNYTKVSTANTVYMQATGTTSISVANKTLTASYTSSTVRDLKNDITNNARKTDVVTTLDVYMTPEESDDRVYDKVKFTMPSGMGLLQLRLHTPWFTVIRDEETTAVNLQEGVQGYNSAVKAWAAGLTHIYKVETDKKGEVTILFPWEWPDRADLDGLRVSYCDVNGKDTRTLAYAVVTGGIQFVMPANGYFAIRNLNREYPTMPFNDCQTSWAYSYICHAYETGLVAGTSATTFDPQGLVTRSQLVTLLARMRGFDDSKWYGDVPYTDVPENAWYARAVSFCYAAGALKPDGNEFKPDEPVTRAQTVALAEALFPYKGVLWTPFNCSDRPTVPTYGLRPMDAFYTCGIINGVTADTFAPDGKLTRAEIVTILYRLQVADYWQVKTTMLKSDKLDSKYVKTYPSIWIDDQASYFSGKTSDIQSAMKYFFDTTGVRPYLVTTKTAKDAAGIYEEKFSDNGHMVILITKLNDRGGIDVTTYVGSDAKTVVDADAVDMLMEKFTEFWNSSTLTTAEAVTAFFRTGADDVMATEVSTNPTGWEAPKPVRDYDPTKPATKTTYIPCAMTFTESEFINQVKSGNAPTGFSAYTTLDNNWQTSSGKIGRWDVTVLKSSVYYCVRFQCTDITESVDIEELKELFGLGISAEEMLRISFTYYGVEDATLYDANTASTLRATETAGFGQILINPPTNVVQHMLEGYANK